MQRYAPIALRIKETVTWQTVDITRFCWPWGILVEPAGWFSTIGYYNINLLADFLLRG